MQVPAPTRMSWWLEEAGDREPGPALEGTRHADVVVVGGGFTGLWAAWQVKALDPEARVVVLEAERCGEGPSGRNGGFVNVLWFSLPSLRKRFGDGPALATCRAAEEGVREIGRFCEDQEVDAWFTPGGYLQISAGPGQDGAWREAVAACRELGADDAVRVVGVEEARRRSGSPLARGGAFYPASATVHPARLVLGLRDALRGAGVEVLERSRVRELQAGPGRVEVAAATGGVVARACVLAAGSWLPLARPLRRALTLTSSHMVITEPIPDLLEEIGWTGGECVTDSRAMIHYGRTTPDGRIAFGWGGGRIVAGARLGDRAWSDPEMTSQVARHLVRLYPTLEGVRIDAAWGGPIDVSPTHLPLVGTLPGGPVHWAGGYTGNGVGPSHLAGRILARLALGIRDELTALPIVGGRTPSVPPEPLRVAGGSIIRRALVRKEAAEEEGRRPALVDRAIAGLPRLIGFHVGR